MLLADAVAAAPPVVRRAAGSTTELRLEGWPTGVRLAATGRAAFELLVRRIREARRSIGIRAYVWRQDETGMMIGNALLEAADRGVEITIRKDRDAATYEYYEGRGQSFFHKDPSLYRVLETSFLNASYEGRVSVHRQQPNPVRDALLAHPRVYVAHEGPVYDHAKVFVFDEETLVFGGMCIGDDAHHRTLDFMVELDDPHLVRRYRDHVAGAAEFEPDRDIDFLLQSRDAHGIGESPMRAHRLALIHRARRTLAIEMAYFGEPAFTDAIVGAVERGVRTTVIAGARATILRHVNRYELDELLRRTGAPPHLRVVLHPREVHSKAVVVDDHLVDIGSANFTHLSHGTYEEVNVCIRNRAVARGVLAVLASHAEQGELVHRVRYPKVRARLERMFMDNYARYARQRARRLFRAAL